VDVTAIMQAENDYSRNDLDVYLGPLTRMENIGEESLSEMLRELKELMLHISVTTEEASSCAVFPSKG